jgi:Bacterial extracellular solute-binding proteins, family 3.
MMKKILSFCLLLVMLAVAAEPAFASDNGLKTGKEAVRMGYFEFGGMFSGAQEDAAKSGYCYEYMMQVATYTGWNYEFCYGTYAELYEKLKNGEIDILPYTNYNDQRGEEVLFSDKVLAEEEYYIAVPSGSDNETGLRRGDVISTLEGADYNELLLNYIEETTCM